MDATRGDYEIDDVEGITDLRREIKRMYQSDTPEAILADLLLNGHEGSGGYLTFGNNKVAKNTGIFNMNSATDCPNADSSESDQTDTGVCQVPWEDCYAHVSENIFNDALPKRRRQEYLWDCVTPELFGKALLLVKSRKRSDFEHLRVSESGDFRHNGDIIAWERVADIVSGKINVYTYSASHKLDAWNSAEQFTVNQSNNLADYGDRRFNAISMPTLEESEFDNMQDLYDEYKPDGATWCPFDYTEAMGGELEDRPKCGECTLCIEKDAGDVVIPIHG